MCKFLSNRAQRKKLIWKVKQLKANLMPPFGQQLFCLKASFDSITALFSHRSPSQSFTFLFTRDY